MSHRRHVSYIPINLQCGLPHLIPFFLFFRFRQLVTLTRLFPINSNNFMDNNPLRALYPYADRAHAAITTVFRENLGLFKGIGAEGTNEEGEYVGLLRRCHRRASPGGALLQGRGFLPERRCT